MSQENNTSNRGLASADEETKEWVAKAGGESRAQDKEGLSEAGRKGGESVSQDREHMSEIGKKADKARIAAEATSDILIKILRHIFCHVWLLKLLYCKKAKLYLLLKITESYVDFTFCKCYQHH